MVLDNDLLYLTRKERLAYKLVDRWSMVMPNYSSKRALKHDSKDTSIKVVGVSFK